MINDPTAPPPSPVPTPPPSAPPPPPPPAGPPASGAAAVVPSEEPWLSTLPAEAQAHIRELRRENAGWRHKVKELEPAATQLKAITSAMGKDGQPVDPVAAQKELQEGITRRDGIIREQRVTIALSDLYGKHSVKPTLTRALLRDSGLLDDINPEDPDFSKTLGGAIKKLADEHPEIKLTGPAPSPPRSSGEFKGPGAPSSDQWTPEMLKDARARHQDDAIARAFREGKLDDIMNRSTKPT